MLPCKLFKQVNFCAVLVHAHCINVKRKKWLFSSCRKIVFKTITEQPLKRCARGQLVTEEDESRT